MYTNYLSKTVRHVSAFSDDVMCTVGACVHVVIVLIRSCHHLSHGNYVDCARSTDKRGVYGISL